MEGCGGYGGVAEVAAVEVDYPVFGRQEYSVPEVEEAVEVPDVVAGLGGGEVGWVWCWS